MYFIVIPIGRVEAKSLCQTELMQFIDYDDVTDLVDGRIIMCQLPDDTQMNTLVTQLGTSLDNEKCGIALLAFTDTQRALYNPIQHEVVYNSDDDSES